MAANSATKPADAAAEAAPKLKSAADTPWYVVDTTATHDAPRTHEQIVSGRVKPFKFEADKPHEMPAAIAVKFLKHDAFKRTDKDGNPLEYKRAPRQPEELGAGEQLVLADDQTVARFEELSTQALHQRVLELALGDKFCEEKRSRDELLDFMLKAKKAAKKAAKPDRDADEFVPEAELDDEAA